MTVLNEFTFLNGVTAPCYSKELLNNAGGGLVLAVSDGFDGSITVQGKQNGEWYTLAVVDLVTASTADAITAAGSYSVNGVAGFSRIRLNLTAVSGTATVSGRLTTEPGTILAATSSESGGGGGGGGSGDFSTCNVTVQLIGTYDSIVLDIPYICEDSTYFTEPGLSSSYVVNRGEPQNLAVVLYKNCAFAFHAAGNSSISTTGSITYDDDEEGFVIRGDGTITITHA